MMALAPVPDLQTERLALRPLRQEDADAMFAILGDPAAMAHWDTPPLVRAATAAEIIAGQISAMADGNFLCWTVWRGSDAIGSVDLSAIDTAHARADIGFLFRRDVWGQGYAREAMTALIAHGFGPLKLARLGARIQADNRPAARLLTRLGFAREGLLKAYVMRDGLHRDCELYGFVAAAKWSGGPF